MSMENAERAMEEHRDAMERERELAARRAENEHLLKCSHAWMLEANKATARIAELMAALETALRPLKLEHAYLNEAVDDHCNKKAPNGVAWQDCFCITAGDLRQASRLWDGFIDPPCTAAALKETPNDEG